MKVILNPPYSGNLHLKILREAMQHSDDIVNLSPIRWLEDPLAEYKKNSDWKTFEDIRTHIENVDKIGMNYAATLFEAGFTMDLGIYKVNMTKTFNTKQKENKIVNFLVNNQIRFPKLEVYNPNRKQAFVTIKTISNPDRKTAFNIASNNNGIFVSGKTLDGRCWKDVLYQSKSFSQTLPNGLYFNTVEEAKNFLSWTNNKIIKYIVKQIKVDQNMPLKFLPFMPTYTHPWTDADLYAYFGLTADEIGIIEKEMA